MNCRDEGFVQAYLDGECGMEEARQFTDHLKSCAACRQIVDELTSLDEWTKEKLDDHFASESNQVQIDTAAAWQRFSKRIEANASNSVIARQQESKNRTFAKRSWVRMKKRTRQWVTGVSAAAVVAVALSVPQVQAAASDFLSIFRVNQVEFVKLTQEDLQQAESWISSSKAGELDLEGLGKVWIEQKDESEERTKWFDSLEAAQQAGVKLPQLSDEFTVSGVEATEPFTLHMELDVAKANKMFAQLQMEERFDEQLDGKRFSMRVPETTSLLLQKDGTDYSYHVIGGLELEAPEGVDLENLRNTVLALPFIPENVKKQMLAIDNWQQTLPMPYLETEDDQVKEVKVNGEKALLINSKNSTKVIWQENGALHSLEGYEADAKDEILQIAKLLK